MSELADQSAETAFNQVKSGWTGRTCPEKGQYRDCLYLFRAGGLVWISPGDRGNGPAKGLKNVLVTNAYLNRTPLQELVGLIDAVNVDLKAFNDDFYRRICGGCLQPVLDNIELLAGSEETHLEVTTLLINGLNDREEELRPLFAWLAGLSRTIPLHLSRYFPRYQLERPATPLAKMKKAYRLAKEYLDYVYLGNINHAEGRKTYCPACGEELISRDGFRPENHLLQNRCPACSYVITGRFKKL